MYELTPRVPRVLDHSELRQGWGEFLGRWTWHWFCTFTFDPAKVRSPKGFVHPEKAIKAFRLFVNELNCSLYGRNWKRRASGVYWVLALEKHKRGAIHLHALIGADHNLNESALRMFWKEWWYRHFGIAVIEEPRDAGDVQDYCSKYVTKGGDLVLSPNLGRVSHQSALELSGKLK